MPIPSEIPCIQYQMNWRMNNQWRIFPCQCVTGHWDITPHHVPAYDWFYAVDTTSIAGMWLAVNMYVQKWVAFTSYKYNIISLKIGEIPKIWNFLVANVFQMSNFVFALICYYIIEIHNWFMKQLLFSQLIFFKCMISLCKYVTL